MKKTGFTLAANDAAAFVAGNAKTRDPATGVIGSGIGLIDTAGHPDPSGGVAARLPDGWRSRPFFRSGSPGQKWRWSLGRIRYERFDDDGDKMPNFFPRARRPWRLPLHRPAPRPPDRNSGRDRAVEATRSVAWKGGAAMTLRKRLRIFGRLLLAILTLLWVVSLFAASSVVC